MSGVRSAAAEAVAAAVLWGSIGVVFRLAVEKGADPRWLILGRPLLASVPSLVCVAAGCGGPSRWSLVVGLLGLAPLYASYFLAVERVGAAVASLLLYTAPLWVAAASGPLLGERPGRRVAAASVLGFLGAALIVLPGLGGRVDPLGAVLGLASGASYASYMVLARLAASRGAGVAEVSLHSLPFAALGVAAVARPHGSPGAVGLLAALYLAAAGTLVPYALSARALSRLPAARVAVISLVEPVTAVALAWLLLGEELRPLQLVGAALVLSSSVAAALG